ncbi:hypothetical protein NQ314_007843 [Rhamnusium bicolor]|uniref:Uncharacterized protein n=1 Tax=Rhamnusium bicolor TaxID=1586634 RepID=A0AAV8YFT1_9CUCU|nr:hypothetical protein NQ314_007843 [Rhamnusium bicolor]
MVKWSTCLNKIADTRRFGKPADFDAVTKRGNLFALINYWYVNCGVITCGISHILTAGECKQRNEDEGLHEVCGTVTAIWLPFEGDKLMIQIIITTLEILVELCIMSPAGVLCILSWETVEVLISHINHFKSNFLKIFEESTVEGRSKQLKFCIQYHNHILRYTLMCIKRKI